MEIAASNIGQVSKGRRSNIIWGILVKFFDWFGQIAAFCGRLAREAIYPPYEWRELLQCDLTDARQAYRDHQDAIHRHTQAEILTKMAGGTAANAVVPIEPGERTRSSAACPSGR